MESCENDRMQTHLLDRRLPAYSFTYQRETRSAVRRRIITNVLQIWVKYLTQLLFHENTNFGCHKSDDIFCDVFYFALLAIKALFYKIYY